MCTVIKRDINKKIFAICIRNILFKVNATNKRADIDEQATMIDLEQLMLLDDTISKQRHHRRVQSHS